MASHMNNRLALDGLVCLYEDFDFLDNKQSWVLPPNIMVQIKNQRDFKGVKSLKGKKIAEVKFGYFNNMPLSILVTSELLDEQIPFSDIREVIAKGVDHAVNKLGANSTTKLDWKMRCCMEFEKWINKTNCGLCKSRCANMRHSIYAEDVLMFKKYFGEYLQVHFANINFGLFIAFYEFGQNLEWYSAIANFKNLNVANASEIVVHVARDYSQKGKVLLWNRESIRKLMGGSPSSDFYACFTGKHGNFVYDSTNDNSITYVKFYNDMFKQVHRGSAPFRKPCVVSVLSGVNQRQRGHEDLENIERLADTLTRCKDLVVSRKQNCARVEAIISLHNEDYRGMRHLLWKFAVKFEKEFGHAARSLSVFEFTEMENQINSSLTPALKTLKDIAESEKGLRVLNPVHCTNIETLHLAMACEMLISYFIYGKLDYWSGDGPRYNECMRKNLKLNGNTFREAETFRGLGFTDVIILRNGELRYTGELFVTEFVSNGIADEENRDRLTNCLEILGSNNSNMSRINEVYEVLAEILWDEILLYSRETKYLMPYTRVSKDFICSFISENPHYAISSNEFVKQLFINICAEQRHVIRRIIQAVTYIVGSSDILKNKLESKIEMEIWKSGISLLYPADESWKNKHWSRSEGGTLVVLPSCGAGNHKFSTTTNDVKKTIAFQYRACFYSLHKYNLTKTQIIAELSKVENYNQTDHQSDLMEDIFREMVASYILSQF